MHKVRTTCTRTQRSTRAAVVLLGGRPGTPPLHTRAARRAACVDPPCASPHRAHRLCTLRLPTFPPAPGETRDRSSSVSWSSRRPRQQRRTLEWRRPGRPTRGTTARATREVSDRLTLWVRACAAAGGARSRHSRRPGRRRRWTSRRRRTSGDTWAAALPRASPYARGLGFRQAGGLTAREASSESRGSRQQRACEAYRRRREGVRSRGDQEEIKRRSRGDQEPWAITARGGGAWWRRALKPVEVAAEEEQSARRTNLWEPQLLNEG